MTAIAFDTLKFVERLEKAGVPREQAAAMAEAFKEVGGEADLATKRDLEYLELKLKSELGLLSADINLVKWMLGVVLAIAVANFAKQFF